MSGPFRSVEEAYAFVRSHEVATNNRYVVAKSKGINKQDLTSLESYNIQWQYTSGVRAGSEKVEDGIPFIYFGIELRDCQYGPPRKRIKSPPTESEASNQEVVSKTEETTQTSGTCTGKRRRTQPSKKLNCPSKVKIKKILKFPEYSVEIGKEYPSSFKTELGKQLKANFSKDTKRYVLVYVHIDNNHNHGDAPIDVQCKYKKITHVLDKGCTRISVDSVPKPVSRRAPLLKKWASLMGKNLMDLVMQFKTTTDLPETLAQPKPDQKLEEMQDEELVSLYHDITGEIPNNMFTVANKEFTTTNLRLLLHLSIIFANAASDDCTHQQTHPSVRVKGTEDIFTPVQCLELDCAIIEAHMHCPLCAKTDCYTDPSLLKAHFKNRHVDKAIEFAGLRILRCYDNCEVAGKNKDCKTFKGGHWHCYKCANGLDKRNSAIAHYQSHVRNYESNFQIQVTQDVNPALSGITVPHEIDVTHATSELYQTSVTLHNVATTSKGACCNSSFKRSYADTGLETIDSSAMFVQDDEIGNVTSTYTAQEIPTAGNETYVITVPDSGELTELRNKVRELEMNCRELEKKNTVQKSLIEFMQMKDVNQTKAIEDYKYEKQDLISQLDTCKSEIAKLKFTSQKSSAPTADTCKHSAAKHYRSGSQGSQELEQVPSDVRVSLDKAKELEKRLKNTQKESAGPSHKYGTRTATRKYSSISNDNVPAVAKISKPNEGKMTGFDKETKTSKGCRTSQIGSMEEMFNQLSSMRQEIDLLKQTAFVKSDISMQHVASVSGINNVSVLHSSLDSVSGISNSSVLHSPLGNTNVSDISNVSMLHSSLGNTSVSGISNALILHSPLGNRSVSGISNASIVNSPLGNTSVSGIQSSLGNSSVSGINNSSVIQSPLCNTRASGISNASVLHSSLGNTSVSGIQSPFGNSSVSGINNVSVLHSSLDNTTGS
ncbi:uncharacterized protein LOC132714060 isoform X2 [Ruditapes philippinarum]|uniref:uncharacterized protein LOC132714060 isoform X2 n=1 Tax=Ruditapes philippinarum TaxID=129788 RepID=UPI00295B6920|nr:uncharacterized protein LOC132714060 isoform X2 [Ruditapes philippinarum]